jgi:hypothetical protein
MVLVHAVVFAPFVYQLKARVVRYEWAYRRYNVKPPAASQWAFTASTWVADDRPANLAFMVGLLAADVALLWFLNRESRALGWAWFVLVILAALLLALAATGAVALADLKLREVFSRYGLPGVPLP